MQTKSLLIGIASFILGGLTVATAAATINRPAATTAHTTRTSTADSMTAMNADLRSKTGDDYDKAFLADMIAHHQGAVDMANQSASQAKHDEIKQLSNDIVRAQQAELTKMKQWQRDWGYVTGNMMHDDDTMDGMMHMSN